MITRVASRIVFARSAVAGANLRLQRQYSERTLSPVELENILAKQIDQKLVERPNFKKRYEAEMVQLEEL